MHTPEFGSHASPEQQSDVEAQQSPVWLHAPPPDDDDDDDAPSIASERPPSPGLPPLPLPLPLSPPISS